MTITPEAPVDVPLAWVSRLADHGDRPAIVTSDGTLCYSELATRVDTVAARLAGERRLVLLEARATVESVVSYLAAITAGHAVLLAPAGLQGPAQRLAQAYDPDIRLGSDGSVSVHRCQSAHELHPDLALLLSTSGSTGSPKLVRLSAANLAANTEQIAQSLRIGADDRAALTLPITYCYGLSVLNTHLARGASVLLTDLSVVDECFWQLFRESRATTFAGVPHTFEMLERSGFADRAVPHLRYVTQAGGRMDPERVRRWAELGRRRGWDLVVMYGQSEATARMTYLPPHLAADHPDTVGLPVPGASVTVDDGEIVFDGPNVMLGYAHRPSDLALGRTVDVLRTGDLGRLTPEGLLQVTGRRARFVKVLGHRIDLDALERRLRADGHDVRCSGRDDLLVLTAVGAGSAPARETVRRAAVAGSGVPADAVRVQSVTDHPALASGKPDYAGVLALAPANEPWDGGPTGTSVAELYAALLRRCEVPADATFAGLGGDSLSYVEVSIRLEELLGRLPASWHVMPVAELERIRTSQSATIRPDTSHAPQRPSSCPSPGPGPREPNRQRRGWRQLESSVWLRALAIVLIVATHADLATVQGSANALLVIAGYQLVRFQLSAQGRRERVSRILRAALRIAAPTFVVVAGAHVLGGYYETRNLLFANWLVGEARLGPPWRFWFIEALVWALLLTSALVALPAFQRWERRFPLMVPLALTTVAFVLFRLPVLPLPIPHMQGSAHVVLYLFLLGWTIARVRTLPQRLLMSLVVLGSIGTFSFNERRDGLTIALVLVLMWFPVTRVPAVLVPLIRPLAAASLYIYVIHWQALEVLWGHPVLAFAGSLALGLGYWWAWTTVSTVLTAGASRLRSRALQTDPSMSRSHRTP